MCSLVANCCLKISVVLHGALHGFREGQGTGAATLEENLSQKLVGLAHEPLFRVFLDVRKEYDSLDRGRSLEILKICRLGTNLSWVIKTTGSGRGLYKRQGIT